MSWWVPNDKLSSATSAGPSYMAITNILWLLHLTCSAFFSSGLIPAEVNVTVECPLQISIDFCAMLSYYSLSPLKNTAIILSRAWTYSFCCLYSVIYFALFIILVTIHEVNVERPEMSLLSRFAPFFSYSNCKEWTSCSSFQSLTASIASFFLPSLSVL